MPITNTPVLSEDNKKWIRNNSSKFTAKEIADYFGVYQQLITRFCRHHKLSLKKSTNETKPIESEFFNVVNYYTNETVTI